LDVSAAKAPCSWFRPSRPGGLILRAADATGGTEPTGPDDLQPPPRPGRSSLSAALAVRPR